MADLDSELDILDLSPTDNNNIHLNNTTPLARVLSDKHINSRTVKATLLSAWNFTDPDIQVLDNNTLSCSFKKEEDLKCIINGSPWSVRGAHIILKQWLPSTTFDEIDFSTSQLTNGQNDKGKCRENW